MTHELALTLSTALVEAGFSHQIGVGINPKLAPGVQAHVSVALHHASRGGSLAEGIAELERIAHEHALELRTSMLGGDLQFTATDPRRSL